LDVSAKFFNVYAKLKQPEPLFISGYFF
jgi:hypothetical protein